MPDTTSLTTIDGVTTDGHRARVIVDITVPAAAEQVWPPPIVVGTTVKEADFGLFRGRARGSRFARTFSPDGRGFLPWSAPNRQLPDGVAEFHSWKDWPADTTVVDGLTAWLDAMPARLLDEAPLLPHLRPYDPDGYSDGQRDSDGLSWLVTWCHEGERNMIEAGIPAREWRRRHRLAYKTIRQHRHGHRVGYMSVGTLTWLAATSDLARGVVKGDYDPFAWWSGVGDFAAIDCYAPTITEGRAAPAMYPTPAKFFGPLVELAAGTGRRPFVPELGVARQGDPADTGTLRANWITNCVQYLDSIGTGGVAWWDATGSKDFRLTDPASAAAWSAELTRRNRDG
jgi:hypothetical protein